MKGQAIALVGFASAFALSPVFAQTPYDRNQETIRQQQQIQQQQQMRQQQQQLEYERNRARIQEEAQRAREASRYSSPSSTYGTPSSRTPTGTAPSSSNYVPAPSGSSGYRRAIQCSADAAFVNSMLRSKVNQPRDLISRLENDASRWLAVATNIGEKHASQAWNDRSDLTSKISQAYYMERVEQRNAYLQGVANRVAGCQANPPR